MPASIAIIGLGANYPTPGVYPQVQFAQGLPSGGSATYAICILANKTTAGTATVDTVIYGPDTVTPMQNQSDMNLLGGLGSEAARIYAKVIKVNPTTPVYCVFVTESVGANATGTITLTTTATGPGTLRIYLNANEFVDTPIATGDAVGTTAAAAILNVNGKTDWPFIASSGGGGVITLTAKQKGLRGNWLRFWSRIFPACGMTTSTATPAFFTGGGSADSNATALATILPKRFYWIVSAAEDATQVGALNTQLNAQAVATSNIRQIGFFGSVDTLGNAQNIAIALNAPRLSATLLTQGDWTPGELAGNTAALVALGTNATIPRMNFDDIGLSSSDPLTGLWNVPAPMSGAAPTPTQIASGLNNGVTMIGVTPQSKTYLVMPITTRSLAGASQPDYQVRDLCKVFISDFYTDDLAAKVGAMMPGKTIANDPIGNAPAPGGPTVTPKIVLATTNKLTQDYYDRGEVQNVAAVQAGTIVLRETSPSTRMSIQVPLQVADVWHQTGIDVRQVA